MLHFLGLVDRYEDKDKVIDRGDGTSFVVKNTSVIDDGWKNTNDPMTFPIGTKINQTHYDNYGRSILQKGLLNFVLTRMVDVDNSDPNLGKVGKSATGLTPEEKKVKTSL